MAENKALEQLRATSEAELRKKLGTGPKVAETEGLAELPFGEAGPAMGGDFAEAIIVVDREKRPALVVRNNTFEQPTSASWKTLLNANKVRLERAIRSVGRLELENHPTFPYVGTAWMLGSRGLAITNRHVAKEFAVKKSSGYVFLKSGGSMLQARVDFREEFNVSARKEVAIEKVLFISEDGDQHPDLAIVKLASGSTLPDPIPLLEGSPKKDQAVVVIGYPASDPRNPASAQATVFGDVFEVKRLSPGFVTQQANGFIFQHDCSTLGGNSGSMVVDIETGEAVGLHFGGRFRQANFAVTAAQIKQVLRKLRVQVAVPDVLSEAAKKKKAPKPKPVNFDDREGYLEDFLGAAAQQSVPLPKPTGDRKNDITKVKGTEDNLLRYTHFSILMSAERRLCHFAAVNIDGQSSRNVRRANDNWSLDPRIPEDAQIGNELYANNDLDRGHMVRRLDPVWGDDFEQANNDTFVYTNSTPQHANLNQKTWNDLEDYVLDNTKAHDLKVCVFTGPVFADDDPVYRDVRLPQQFWKVVTVVNGDTNTLHATAYILSQKDMLNDLEFVFGQFRTYQLPIAVLAEKTQLSFGKLANFDPLKQESVFPIREISRLEEIVL